MGQTVIIPSSGDAYVSLSRTSSGHLFRKHILNKGTLIHPVTKKPITIDDQFIGTVVDNFRKKVCDIVQFPLAGAKNEHTEDPARNLGEVVDLQVEGDKVYAVLDVRDDSAIPKMGKTILGASAMLSLDYTDSRTGKPAGPTLLHVCATNRPYVLDLDDYEELVAATADDSSDAVLLTAATQEVDLEGPQIMDLDDLLATLRDEHGIDVAALQAQVAAAETATSLSNTLRDALVGTGTLTLSAGQDTVTNEDILGAVASLAEANVALTAQVEESKKTEASVAVKALVAAGKIIPAQESAMTELYLSNADLFNQLVPEAPVVKLSGEAGTGGSADREGGDLDIDAEIARYASFGKELGYSLDAK